MAGVPSGLQSIPLGYLQPLEARHAMTSVADRHGVGLDPGGLDLAVQRAGGLPVAVQAWGDAATRAGYESAKAVSPLRAILIDQGILESPQRGSIAIAIAGFGRWYTHTRHNPTAASTTPRIPSHPPPPRTMAADQHTP